MSSSLYNMCRCAFRFTMNSFHRFNHGEYYVRESMSSLSSGNRQVSPQTVKVIEGYLKQKEIQYQHGHTTIIAKCPFCASTLNSKSKKPNDDEGLFTLFVNKMTGSHVCNSCGTSGTWSQFKTWLSEKKQLLNITGELNANCNEGVLEEVGKLWEKTKPFGECKESLRKYISKTLEIQPLSSETLKLYKVHTILHKFPSPDGSMKQLLCLAFPWFDYERDKICGVKLHKVKVNDEEAYGALEPRHGFPSMFGWHTVPNDAKEIVLTADELDAMAVFQSSSFPAVSLPLGLSSLPPEVLPHLEQFEKIILWFRNDVRSRQAANKFARKVNIQRCHFVRIENNGPVSALDALKKGCDLKSIISEAHPASHKKIVTFQQLRDDVYNELCNVDQVAGIKWSRYPKLSEILKGHRRGELTVFTGGTGTGKTTLLSELSLDLCTQGVNTLWGSFEVRNVRLAKTMLSQFSGINLEKNLPQYNYWAEKFEMIPMYFMSFYGAQNLQEVMETMSHAAYVYDIEHVIVDNLQFMISNAYSPDRFHAQNVAIGEFRKFATSKNVHVTIVIHPRKESDDAELQTASIFGSAKASQEADNVIILQDKKGKNGGKYLQVTKNRFDGTLGRVYLDFDRDSLTMSSYQTKISQSLSSKKENKFPRSLKSSKNSISPRKTRSAVENEERKLVTSAMNSVKDDKVMQKEENKNVNVELEKSFKQNKFANSKVEVQNMAINSLKEHEEHIFSQTSSDDSDIISPTEETKPSNLVAKHLVEVSEQAVTVKRNHDARGTILSSKGSRFAAGESKNRSFLTGKKISVKQ